MFQNFLLVSIGILVSFIILIFISKPKTDHFLIFVDKLEASQKFNDTKVRNRKRLDLLKNQCKLTGYNIKQRKIFENLLVSNSKIHGNTQNFISGAVFVKDGFHKKGNTRDVVLCAPAKTGTSSWRTGIMSMYHLNYTVKDAENGEIKPNSSLKTNPDVKTFLNNWKLSKENKQKFFDNLLSETENSKLLKVLHVRNPLRRIYSAWSDKFFDYDKNEVFYEKFFRRYQNMVDESIKSYESAESLKFRTVGHKKFIVSFQAFLRWIVSGKGLKQYKNAHWSPMYEYCDVCAVKYDVISKLESIELDIELVLDKLNATGSFSFPRINQKNRNDSSLEMTSFKRFDFDSGLVDDYLKSGVDENLLNSFYDIYKLDFRFFDYDFQNFKKSFLTKLNKTYIY